MLSGASLTTEKTYLMGKFAHMCLRTANIDYNGRLCMVSAAAGNKKAFGIDRAANPWTDILGAEVVWITGANVAECAPITTNYVWQAREQGAKVIVVDPRITPIARTCDLFLPVKPGRDAALFSGILRLMIENDWLDHEFIAHHTVGFEAVAERGPRVDAAPDRRGDRHRRALDPPGGRVVGHREDQLPAPRARASSTTATASQNVLWRDQHRARFRADRPARTAATGRSPGRPTARGAASTARSATSSRAAAISAIPSTAPTSRASGAWTRRTFRSRASTPTRSSARSTAARSGACCRSASTPSSRCPTTTSCAARSEKLDFYVAIDFFLSETARYADVVLPGSLQEEDEGTVTQLEGRVIKINRAVECPGEARRDWQIIQDLARALGRERGLTFAGPREMFEELRVASKGDVNDYSGITWERIEENFGVFWPCPDETPEGVPAPPSEGTVRLFEPGSWNPIARGAGPFYFPDGKARFNVTPFVGPAEDVDADYPIILTTGRVVSQFLSGNQTRRIGPLIDQYPEPRIEMHPRLAGRLGIADGDWATAESRRGHCTLRVSVVTTIRPDTVFIPYHWAGRKSANQLTMPAQDPISKIPEYKVCAVRVRRAEAPPEHASALEPQQ